MVGVSDSLRISLKAKGVAMRTFASFLLALVASFLLIPSHLQVDIQGSYRIGKGLSFVMYGLNLNNEVFGYQGSRNS